MNNRGWGLSEMIILCCILGSFLILVVVLVNQLYSGIEQLEAENERYGYSYQEIENNLENAAKSYYRKNNSAVLIMSDDLLLEDYITSIKLTPVNSSEPCIGYVTVSEDKTFDAYISCENYETVGY